MAEYKKHIKKILRRLHEKNLKINIKKCEFYKIEVKYLENIVKRNNIKINFDKIKFVQKWPISTNIKKVQNFLGFINFNRIFIQGFSQKIYFLI